MAPRTDDWTDWLDRHGPAMVLLARQFTDSHADAEDVVQEAFVRFWRDGRLRAEDPTAYLFATVRRTALNHRRGAARRRIRETGAGVPADAATADDADPMFGDPLVRDEWRTRLQSALGELPAEQREVLVLRVWGGLTFQQAADALDIPPDTAASRHRYAIAALRRRLGANSE